MLFGAIRNTGRFQQHHNGSRAFAGLASLLLTGALAGLGCSSSEETPPPAATPTQDAAPPPQVDAGTATDPACDAFTARATAEELVVGPTDLEKTITDAIAAAKTSIDLAVSELNRKSVLQALVAAKQRGVTLRVVVERSAIADAKSALGADIVHETRADLTTHARVLVIDGQRALVGSFDLGTTTIEKDRSFSAFVVDAADVEQLRKLVEHDWNAAAGSPDLACTKLVVSPGNGRERVTSLIDTAEARLDLALAEATDAKIVSSLSARAGAGIKVRVLLADPDATPANKTSGDALAKAGVEVRYYRKLALSTSLVVTDRAALVGSHVMSTASLDTQRDVSVLVANEASLASAGEAFDADWAVGALQ